MGSIPQRPSSSNRGNYVFFSFVRNYFNKVCVVFPMTGWVKPEKLGFHLNVTLT